MMKILNELTLARPRLDGSNVMSLADPELHNYPIAYMSEPGFWSMDEDEVKGLRAYLSKGGFMIFDDFRGRDWDNLQDQMRLAFPTGQWVELDASAAGLPFVLRDQRSAHDDAALRRACRRCSTDCSRTTIATGG